MEQSRTRSVWIFINQLVQETSTASLRCKDGVLHGLTSATPMVVFFLRGQVRPHLVSYLVSFTARVAVKIASAYYIILRSGHCTGTPRICHSLRLQIPHFQRLNKQCIFTKFNAYYQISEIKMIAVMWNTEFNALKKWHRTHSQISKWRTPDEDTRNTVQNPKIK